MSGGWMTLIEVATERKITLTEAQRLVDSTHCPKVFKTNATLYLLKESGR